jgi:hypothetical protein
MAGAERIIEGPIAVDTSVPDSALTREQIIARNLKVVEAHFHNETPEHVEKAIALYGDTISWEAPTRGVVMNDKDEILEAYRATPDCRLSSRGAFAPVRDRAVRVRRSDRPRYDSRQRNAQHSLSCWGRACRAPDPRF